MKNSSLKQLMEFLQRMQDAYTAIAVNPFGSHVLETLLATIQSSFHNINKADEAQVVEFLLKFLQVSLSIVFTPH
jgi:hypothetical protein